MHKRLAAYPLVMYNTNIQTWLLTEFLYLSLVLRNLFTKLARMKRLKVFEVMRDRLSTTGDL
jgi:hypothetical protein